MAKRPSARRLATHPRAPGFLPQPKRWSAEQAYGIRILHRRLVRDYEHRTTSSASRVYWPTIFARRWTACRPGYVRPGHTSSTSRSPTRPSSASPTGPLRAKDVSQAFGHDLLPKIAEGAWAELKRLVKLGNLTEADTGNFGRKQ
ncbi:hypothetical protein ACFV8Z_26790 [Streptomyces sp. NPDC059837]|uniref:hypothetical protein n=1 Tax=unclassified Streptomyces TaxID=2593676 RepID=UPI003667CA1B